MIKFNEKNREFHLYNEKISYVIGLLQNEQLGQYYFGKRIRHKDDFSHMFQRHKVEPSITPSVDGKGFTLDAIKQEYPVYGTSDYREPALSILQENGSRITNFVYKSHKIIDGKPQLKGLPAVYANTNDKVQTLEITLEDEVIQTELILSYTIFEEYPVILRNARIVNNGAEEINIEKIMSLSLDLPDSDYMIMQLSGSWARERHIIEREAKRGITLIDSKRGTSSALNNPFIGLRRKNATETEGEIIGLNLIYSGNFSAAVEVDQFDVTRLNIGINHFDFNWCLESGEEFQSPEAVLVYSDEGINGMSNTFHNLYKDNLIRGKFKNKTRPILLNSWEGVYFDFNEEKILKMAEGAKDLGVELFVLDDGWFGTRDDDFQGLGDWDVNLAKLPNGIKGLAEKINEMGLKFGLWFEPEMVNKNSNLYREHSDWILSTPQRHETQSRNQHYLDLSRPEVAEYVYESVAKNLRQANIEYVKWDMNRTMTEVFSYGREAKRQKETWHRYFLGLYSVLERLVTEFPDVLFESCASGGNRFDAGMLYYMPQTWTSDNSDAVDRLKIQYGTSIVYPVPAMGAHVSITPNHQTGRNTSLDIRGNVAMFGTFGYELNPKDLSEAEKDEIRIQIEEFKGYRELMTAGDFYRVKSPFDGNEVAWLMVSKDKKEAVVGYYRILMPVNDGLRRVRLTGLNPEFDYKVEKKKANSSKKIEFEKVGGDELMNFGLLVGTNDEHRNIEGDFYTELYHLKSE